MITSSIACITYITALLVFPGSNSVPFLLPPDELEAQGNLAMNWDVTDLDFLDHLSANDKHACSTGNAFVDKEIKNGPSGEALEFVSNNEEALDTVRSSVSRILKRAIDDDEKKFDQQLQNDHYADPEQFDDFDSEVRRTAQILNDLKTGKKPTRHRDHLKMYVTKYLQDKLAKKLFVVSIRMPWLKMKPGDITNWPADVRFMPVSIMNINEVKTLERLAKEDRLDFSPEFISRFKMTRSRQRYVGDLRSDVVKYLQDKLAKKLNVDSFRVPWSKVKPGDITNWPADLQVMPVSRMNTIELQRLHKLVKANLLDFSPEFIRLRQVELAEGRSSIPEFQNMIKDIETALLNKLNAGSTKKIMEVPWIILKKENVINWPHGVPLQTLSHHTKEHLQLLHKLRDVIYFRKDHLGRL